MEPIYCGRQLSLGVLNGLGSNGLSPNVCCYAVKPLYTNGIRWNLERELAQRDRPTIDMRLVSTGNTHWHWLTPHSEWEKIEADSFTPQKKGNTECIARTSFHHLHLCDLYNLTRVATSHPISHTPLHKNGPHI